MYKCLCIYIYTYIIIHTNSFTYSLFGGLNHRDQLLDPSILFVPPTKELTIVTDSATQDERINKNSLFYPICVIFAVKTSRVFLRSLRQTGRFIRIYWIWVCVRIREIGALKSNGLSSLPHWHFNFLRTPSFRPTQIDEENDDITSRNVPNFSSWMLGWSNIQ